MLTMEEEEVSFYEKDLVIRGDSQTHHSLSTESPI